MWNAIYPAGAAFRLHFGSGHSSARQRDKSRVTPVSTEFLQKILISNCDPDH